MRLMRVRFGELSAAEVRALAALDGKIDALYREALAEARDSTWWSRAFAQAAPGLEAELETSARAIVRPGSRELTPLAERFAAAAPAAISVQSRRPPAPLPLALQRAKDGGFDFARASVRAGFGRGHLLDVVLQQPGSVGGEAERAAAKALVWDLLGERVADDWVRSVDVTPAPRGGPLRVVADAPGPAGFALAELGSAIAAAVAGVHDGLAREPLWAEPPSAEWALLELEPEPADDYDADDDLVLAATCRPELLKCHLERAPFSSARFTRHGEVFFMLKYEDRQPNDARLAARQRLEDEFDRMLSSARAGRVIGAGLGIRYTYLYLGFAEPDATIQRIAALARELGLAKHSWLLPLDSDWANEWVEIWPGATAQRVERSARKQPSE